MNSLDTKYVRNGHFCWHSLPEQMESTQILCAMRSEPVRLGQFSRLMPGTSEKILTQNLRQWEADGIVVKKDISDLVLHIE
jgi:DNA-binding HxlR family transcriptional regulator